MRRYLLYRLLQTLALLVVVSMVAFVLVLAAPGGPSILLDPNMTREQQEEMRRLLGLDQPIHVQYLRWVQNVVRGELGVSYRLGRPVLEIIAQQMPNTLLLSGAALLLTIAVSLPLGILSAARRGSLTDHGATFFAFFGLSMPVFWFGLVLIMIFAVKLEWLPAGGMQTIGAPFSLADRARHLVLPAVVLATTNMAQLTRYTRSSMISVLTEDYVRTARAKGLSERVVLFHHAFKNALIPVLTVIGLLLPRLVGGAAITESVFAWPGMGNLAVRAAFERDYPMIMGVTMVVSLVVVLSTLLVDLLYGLVDPRIRYE